MIINTQFVAAISMNAEVIKGLSFLQGNHCVLNTSQQVFERESHPTQKELYT